MAPAIAVPLIMAGISAAGSIVAAQQGGGPSPPAPVDQTQQNVQNAESTEAAAYAQAQALKKRQGMSSTILTSPLGVQSSKGSSQTLGA